MLRSNLNICDKASAWTALAAATPPPADTEEIHLLDKESERSRLLEEKVARYREEVRSQLNFAGGHRRLGKALALLGNVAEAIPSLREAVRLDPSSPKSHLDLGIALQMWGDHEGAEAAFRNCVYLRPDYAEAHVRLGNVLLALGRIPEAVSVCERALCFDPDSLSLNYSLGIAFLRLGRADQAIGHFHAAARIKPDYASAHQFLGIAYRQMGLVDEAIACYRTALRLAPASHDAQCELADLLCEAGRLEEAVLVYQAAVRSNPESLDAHFQLGNAYRLTQRVAESVHAYQRALAIQPKEAAVHANLGESFLDLGKVPEGVSHLREALRLCPWMILPSFALATSGLAGVAGIGIEQLRFLLATSFCLNPTDASMIHFALGDLLDQAGLTDQAFTHYHQGNALRRSEFVNRGAGFDPRAHRLFVKRLLETFTPAYFRQVGGFGLETDMPVFIVGMPRSGSTLVEQILASHLEVKGGGEVQDLRNLAESLPAQLGSAAPYPECMVGADAASLRVTADACLKDWVSRCGRAARITDKVITNFLHLGLVATLYPRARVIHCRRDPLDTCLSCYFKHFKGMNFSYNLEDLGHYYVQYERTMAHWREVLPIPIHDVVYEELVAEPERVSRELVDYCGLAWDARCLRFHENPRPVLTASRLQVRQPIYRTSIRRWRNYAGHLGPLRAILGV